ncbi:MAG TPA: transglycosylase SLT domain-containing protein, partial [Anaerolineales bacterium]
MAVDMERLLDAVRQVESSGNPNAVSPAGAKGPYQFMDATAKQYGVRNSFDELQSRDGARRYLNDLMNQFGTVEHALAAYNGGPGRLARRGGDIQAMPPESQDYVQKVMALYGDNVSTTRQATHDQFNTHQQPVSPADMLFPERSERRRKLASELFTDNRESDYLTESILNPRPVNEAQRIYQMQLRTGMPVSVIERNLDEIEAQVAKQDFDAEKFRAESPLLAEWLVQNPTRASLAQGDYENLSLLEKSMNVFKAVPVGGEIGIKQERSMILGFKAATGTITAQEELELRQLDTELEELNEQFSEGAPEWIKEASKIVGMQIPMAIESAKHGVKWGLPAGAAAGGALGLLGGPGAPVSVTAGAAAGGVMGFKSVAGGKYLELTYQMSVGEAFQELKNAKDEDGNPIDPVAARYASLLVAVPNALMEFASLRTAVKAIPGADKILGKLSTQAMKQILAKPSVVAALKDFGKKYAAAVGTETFTEGMQNVMVVLAREVATGDMGAGLSGQDVTSTLAQMEAAFKGSAVLGVVGSGPRVLELYSQMAKAEQNEQFMIALGDAVANSSTYANSQEALTSYVNHLKENGPIKNVFIPVEKWDLLFQDQAPDAAAELLGSADQYAEAKATGGDLVIPLETYAGKLAGTEFHERLIPDIRLGPGELTPNEALEAEQAEPMILAGLQAELDQTIATEAPLHEIYNDVFNKLKDIGMGTTEANRNAVLWREHIRGMSDLTGLSPQQLYSEQPLTVQREFQGAISDQ